MRITAEFTCEILPPRGVGLYKLRTQLYPFDVKVDGETVCIKPIIDEMTDTQPIIDENGREVGEYKVPYHSLHSLKAVVALDVNPEELESSGANPFEPRALAALSATLRWLRKVTGIEEIDVHVGAVQRQYRAGAGDRLPWGLAHGYTIDSSILGLDKVAWQEVEARVKNHEDTPLVFELLMEARRFFGQRNYNMAVVNAAVACEARLYELVAAALQRQGGISKSAAENLAQEISNKELPALLGCFYDLSTDKIGLIQNAFRMRNSILHGRQRRPVSRKSAEDSIAAAARLVEEVRMRESGG
jgi:hypothetical protein